MSFNNFLGFDPSSVTRVKTLGGRDRVASGSYLAEVTSVERMVAKSNGNCCYWLLLFTILDGLFKGCEIPVRFNCAHQNLEVVELGRGQMAHYLDCIGVTDPQNAADLCNVPVVITVRNKTSRFTSDDGKEVVATVSEIVSFDSSRGVDVTAPQDEPAA